MVITWLKWLTGFLHGETPENLRKTPSYYPKAQCVGLKTKQIKIFLTTNQLLQVCIIITKSVTYTRIPRYISPQVLALRG